MRLLRWKESRGILRPRQQGCGYALRVQGYRRIPYVGYSPNMKSKSLLAILSLVTGWVLAR